MQSTDILENVITETQIPTQKTNILLLGSLLHTLSLENGCFDFADSIILLLHGHHFETVQRYIGDWIARKNLTNELVACHILGADIELILLA